MKAKKKINFNEQDEGSLFFFILEIQIPKSYLVCGTIIITLQS